MTAWLYLRSVGGAGGAAAGDSFAAFDTQEMSDSAAQIDNMSDLNIADTTLVYSKLLSIFTLFSARYTCATQPCIPPGSFNRVPASAGVRAGISPLSGGR